VKNKDGKTVVKTLQTKVLRKPELPLTPNQPPVVKAKSLTSLYIGAGESIDLEDDGSYDPDGTIVKYEWRDMDGILLSDTKVLLRKLYYYPEYDFNKDGTNRYVKTLTVIDNEGKSSSKSFEIFVHRPLNTRPTATAQSVTLDEDTSKVIDLLGSDADGDALTFTVVTPPKHGTYTNGLYTPNPDYHGSDSFTFVANDGELSSAPATVSITINDVAEPDTTPPVITLNGADTITLTQGDSYTELGASAHDDSDGVVDVHITSDVDTSKT